MNGISSDHALFILKQLHAFYLESHLCDVDIIFNKERFKVHRVLFISQSDYFSDILKNENLTEIVVECDEDFDNQIADNLIQYMYTGDIKDKKISILDKIIKQAKSMKLVNLVNFCFTVLENILDPTNVYKIKAIAIGYDCTALVEKCKAYEMKNALNIFKDESFLQLDEKLLIEMISSGDLNVCFEQQAFRAVQNWVAVDFDVRSVNYCKIVSHLRLQYLPTEVVVEEVMSKCFPCKTCFEIWQDLLTWYNMPKKRHILNVLNPKPRVSTMTLLLIGGNIAETSGKICVYNAKTDSWQPFITLVSDMSLMLPILIDDKLVVFDENAEDVTCFYLSLTSKTVNTMTKMDCVMLCDFSVAGMGTKMFVTGGKCGTSISNILQEWNSKTDTWRSLRQMSQRRYKHKSIVCNGKLYVFGGMDLKDLLNVAEVYDPILNDWKRIESMPIKRHSFGIAALDDYIYIVGGHNEKVLTSVERYDTKENCWEILAALPKVQTVCRRTIAFGKKIILFGNDGNFEYDPTTNKWTESSFTIYPSNIVTVPYHVVDPKQRFIL